MNNSVFSRLNFIDVIIILTSANLIFRPILGNISIKLPNPLTINQYGFNHVLQLKPWKQKPKPKPKPDPDPDLVLPDDIIVIILSKVDIVTLCRCTLALSQDAAILPRIASFSTPLEASLFIPDRSLYWYGRLFNKSISNSIVLFLIILGSNSVIPEMFIKLTTYVFLWINMPMLKPEAVDFFKKLTGLRSLVIDLPAMPCYDCRVSPHLWFKWDVRFGVYDTVASNYVVYVFGDKADDNTSNTTVRTMSQMLRAMKTVAYHSMLHCSVVDLGCEEGHWKTGMNMMIKDAERNGSMMIGPKSKWGGGKTRFKIFYLHSTLNFSRYANEDEDPVQAQDVMLLFLAHVDASVDQDDNDVMMACLADQKTELREIVAQFLADENCKVFI